MALIQSYRIVNATSFGSYYTYHTPYHVYQAPVLATPSIPYHQTNQYVAIQPTSQTITYRSTSWPTTTSTATALFHPFTAPCPHSPFTRFSLFGPAIGPPVKTKSGNNTEHVFKPIYSPIWGYNPIYSYLGSIQHLSSKANESMAMNDNGKSSNEMEKEDNMATALPMNDEDDGSNTEPTTTTTTTESSAPKKRSSSSIETEDTELVGKIKRKMKKAPINKFGLRKIRS